MANSIPIGEYVQKLNELLKTKDWYTPGMEVVEYPDGWHEHPALGLDVRNMDSGRLAELERELRPNFQPDVFRR